MWKNCIEDAQEYITLHDCVVNGAEAFDDALSLTFDDGFWILADTKYNSCRETVRTDKSKIKVKNKFNFSRFHRGILALNEFAYFLRTIFLGLRARNG